MDPSLPTTAALAIAGDRVVGGVGTHESALPTPERVDLRGRCVLPAFTDAHVHFPSWSLARRDVQLEGVASLAEALARVGSQPQRGDWIRGRGWRDALWSEHPSRESLDAVTARHPGGAVVEGLPLAVAEQRSARPRGRRPRGRRQESSSGTRPASRPGSSARSPPGGSATGTSSCRRTSTWQRRARASGSRTARGVGAIHDKDGWLGAQAIFARIHQRDGLTLRVWQSLPYDVAGDLAALRLRSGLGDDYLRLGYLKAFMDGTLGSQTAWMLDGSGVCITSGEQLVEIVRDATAAGWPVAVHAIGDRANREALDAFESTRELWEPLGLRQRIEHAQCVDPADLHRFAEIGVACSVQFSHAPSDRDLAERFWGERIEGTYAFATLTRERRGGRERLRCARRGARSARRDRGRRAPDDRRPAGVAPGAGAHGRAGAAGVDRRAGLAGGRRAAPREASARIPRRPRGARSRPRLARRPTSCRRSRSSRRWSAAAGCTTHLPGTENPPPRRPIHAVH